MDSRRAFLKKAAMLGGATAAYQFLPSSIARALAIEVEAGTTYLDAEHVVFLMQENRSFDHCFGTLRGVRGFSDPRAIRDGDGLPAWVQKNAQGEAYGPFRLDIEQTKATWMGSLPHSWKDMVEARNNGKLDTWLEAKKAGNKAYQHLPLTMGYHTRQDIPFYYAFADAFTVCDQHFCSSLTGTSANRSYFWSGTVREEPHNPESVAHVENGQINYRDVQWTTYPERLEKAGISWNVYQNELSLPVGFAGEEEDWLANFTNNNLEFHEQYKVRFHPAHRRWMENTLASSKAELEKRSDQQSEQYTKLKQQIERLTRDLENYSAAKFEQLDSFSKSIHRKAFCTNTADPDYHQLASLKYQDQEGEKKVQVPKGDIFHEFRKDVDADNLPTVSWLVAPCRFSDHPGSPWFGAWYVSEALDILTKNPEIWKKTIFILTYDENDGYFDHVPPFVPAHSDRSFSGLNPEGMDTRSEYVTAAQEKVRTGKPEATLDSPIGLGFRVPMVIASPWSKGGWVNSEVLDLTSNIQFLEHFIGRKFGKEVLENNLSDWRRAVCGDLTSAFRPAASKDTTPQLKPVDRDAEVARIYAASIQQLPGDVAAFSKDELQTIRQGGLAQRLPKQEKGTKSANALPYDVDVNLSVDAAQKEIVLEMRYHGRVKCVQKNKAVPLCVRALAPYQDHDNPAAIWNFTVQNGTTITYRWPLQNFSTGRYHLDLHGPNGFYRSFMGSTQHIPSSAAHISLQEGIEALEIALPGGSGDWKVSDVSYDDQTIIQKKGSIGFMVNCDRTNGWYDLLIEHQKDPTLRYRYAGHVDTGQHSKTDPLMGS
ncbi:phosphocholine-specific phospholipase C [Sphingobacterium chungjuense]|uniref:phosphocholine-specific phospholipase C n=1 Tax=Sphingobacterium chungjuense TaxID=2675553 RepID=UPI00140B9B1D|nr:phospholipase C, phosphocholine-specific [Sphingobacterium chungjuense]